MARILMDGFELGEPAIRTGVFGLWQRSLWQFDVSNTTISADSNVVSNMACHGNYSFLIRNHTGPQRIFRNLGQNITEIYGRVNFRLDPAQSHDGVPPSILQFLDDSFDEVADIRVERNEAFVEVCLYVGGVEVARLAEAFLTNTWARLEWHILIDDNVGVFEFKCNGNSLLNYTGDTDSLGTGHIRYFCIGKGPASRLTAHYDDVALNDTVDDGSGNHSWVGRGGIYLVKPKGEGHYSQWLPSNPTYDNWEMVNTIPHDGDGTYVQGQTHGHRDSYEMETLEDILGAPLEEGTVIKAVQHCFMGRYEDAHAAVETFIRIGETDYDLNNIVDMQNGYFRYWDRILSINPIATQAWTAEAFDALELGIKFDDSE